MEGWQRMNENAKVDRSAVTELPQPDTVVESLSLAGELLLCASASQLILDTFDESD
jgi:hypothetical protein